MAEMIPPADGTLAPCPADASGAPLSSAEEKSGGFVFRDQTHPVQVLEKLNGLRLSKTLCDVVLCSGGKHLPCHRTVLASFSTYFEAMFTTDMKESRQETVDLRAIEPQEMDLLVGYAYTSQVIISSDNVQALLAASNLLGVTAVEEACCRYMERHMDAKNCVGIHCLAERHSCSALTQRSMDYILEHFAVVHRQEEFLSLPEDKMTEVLALERHLEAGNCVGIHSFAERRSCELLSRHSMDHILEHFTAVYRQEEYLSISVRKLTEILASDDLNVSKEEVVLEAAMLWLNHPPFTGDRRGEHFDQVMKHIRLAFINPAYVELTAHLGDYETEICQDLTLASKANHHPRRSTLTDSREVILMLGGWEGERPCRSIQTLDPLADQWKTLGCLPFAVWSPGLVASGSVLFLAGGKMIDGSVSRDLWRYDSSGDTWLKLAPMNEARWNFGLVLLGGSMFAVGGFGGQLDKWKSVDRYDATSDTWQLVHAAGLPARWDGSAVVALGGLIYAVGHCSTHTTFGPQMFKYDPQTSVWTETARREWLPHSDSAACVLNGRIYAIGGNLVGDYRDRDEGSSSFVMFYDPLADQWDHHGGPTMRKRRASPSAVLVDGKIYVIGGTSRTITQHPIERYDDITDWWSVVGRKPQGRSAFSCVSLTLRRDVSAQAEMKQITCANCKREFRSRGGLSNHSRRCNTTTQQRPKPGAYYYSPSGSEWDSD